MSNNSHDLRQTAYYRTADQPTIQSTESPYVKRHMEMLLSAGGLQTGERTLEVGAGTGRFSRLLHDRDIDITASDLSPELIKALRQQAPHIPAFVSDVNALGDQDGEPYQNIIGFFMLHHLADLIRAFHSMAARLKPGGKLIFCEPNAWFFPFYLQILLTPHMRWQVDRGVLNMRRGILTPALQSADFHHIEYTHYGLLPPQLYNRRWGERFDQALELIPLPGRARAFQIIRAHYRE